MFFTRAKMEGAFDTAHRALTVAGMTRHVARVAARSAGWDESRINAFILGHADSKNAAEHIAVGPRRFAYLPLPTIEASGEGRAGVVGSIRRGMLSSFAEDCDAEIAWAQRAMPGHELVDEDKQRPPTTRRVECSVERLSRSRAGEDDGRDGGHLADRYGAPDHLRRFPRLHVRLHWHWRDAQGRPVQVAGPVCFGSGRFYGLGLFTAL